MEVNWIREDLARPAVSGFYVAFFPADPENDFEAIVCKSYYDARSDKWNDCDAASEGYRPTHWMRFPPGPVGDFKPRFQE